MNFAELRFWLYLALILGAVLLVRPFYQRAVRNSDVAMSRYDKTTILIVSLFLLGCVSPLTLAIFLFVCLITYIGLAFFLRGQGLHGFHWSRQAKSSTRRFRTLVLSLAQSSQT